MSFIRRNSTLDSILPTFLTSSPQSTIFTQQQQQPDGAPAAGRAESPRQNRSFLRSLTRIDTTVLRRGSIGLVMSPSPTAEGHEVDDGTFDEMVPEKQGKSKNDLGGKTLYAEEKPGEGFVWDIWARLPKDVRRWHKPASLPVSHVPIQAGSLAINCPAEELPEGWTMHIHPEGKPYYHRVAMEPPTGLLTGTLLFDKGKVLSRPLEILTDSDPRHAITRKTLEHAHFITRVTIAENNFDLPERVQLFLELYPENETDVHPYAGYYLADLDNQTIFWAAPTTTNDLGAHKVNPETFSEQHLKLQMNHQFWWHIECYPLDSSIDVEEANERLYEQLAFMYLDVSTSHTSTSTWTEHQCQGFLSMLKTCPRGRKTWMIARLSTLMMNWQFINLYGHPSARLDRTHSYEVEVALGVASTKEQSISEVEAQSIKSAADSAKSFRQRLATYYQAFVAVMLRITSILLFDAPAAHNEALEKVWVDKIVNKVRFQYLIDRTVKDWGDVSLLSTVLWTANMAFLAIPYPILDPQQTVPLTRTEYVVRVAMITASLASTVFSVGSIAIGLLHIRKHRTERTAEEYCHFLETEHHYLYGHRPLAILWSLPFAFLMWSVLTFSAAVLLFCVTAAGIVPKVPLLTLSGFIIGWIVLNVWYFWKREIRWTMTVDGVERPSFRMKFTNWYWDLRNAMTTKRNA